MMIHLSWLNIRRAAPWPARALSALLLWAIALPGIAQDQPPSGVTVRGVVVDAASGDPIPARIHIQDRGGQWYTCASEGGEAAPYRREPQHAPGSVEVNTTLSAHPFTAALTPGAYTIRVERGKEYLPEIRNMVVDENPQAIEIRLRRWVDMAARGWYSGDTHTHRLGAELETILPAEDLNVAFPLNFWVTRDGELPAGGGKSNPEPLEPALVEIDPTHVVYPFNTEYEITSVNGRSHALGAVFVLNHKTKLDLGAPPVAPIAARARAEGALLDLDKHSWAWSLMLVPVMNVDLFELANNHHWQTKFGFTKWTLENAPEYMNLEMDGDGFTEWGWTDFGFQTYYALLNCGFRMRVSAGTASGVHPVQLGFNRVYVHLPQGFSYDAWMAGLNAGHSFVSNGPLLDVRFNGEDPGHVFKHEREEGATIRVTGSALSARPLDRIEVIRAGDVVQALPVPNESMPGGGYENPIDTSLSFDSSSWIAVRCFEADPDRRVRFAHTNPVFIDIAGRALYPKQAETDYLVQRMESELTRNQGVLDAVSLAEYEQALTAFRERAR